MSYVIYADGSALSNGKGVGGVGILVVQDGKVVKEFSKGYAAPVTNNQMELQAAIAAVKCLPAGDHEIVMDAQYVVTGISEWIHTWKARGWRKTDNKPVMNAELWQVLDGLVSKHAGTLTWTWTRGHSVSPHNNRVDALAQMAARMVG